MCKDKLQKELDAARRIKLKMYYGNFPVEDKAEQNRYIKSLEKQIKEKEHV